MQRLAKLISRFRRDERGVFLPIFAVLAIVLIATSGAVVDFTMTQQARTKAQTALDAAALALQGEMGKTGITADILKARAQAILTQQLDDDTIEATVLSATPDLVADKLDLRASIVVPTYFVQLVGIETISANLQSEVTRSSNNLEVSLALDITGSMGGNKITSLISATNTLIDLLVKDQQTPTYSKMAIVPWASGANLGTYADAIRGAPTEGVNISAITFTNLTKNIESITRNNPGVIKAKTDVTGLANGDTVRINGVGGMTQINGKIGIITNLNTSTRTFNLEVSGTNLCTTSGCGYSSANSNSGTIQKCILTTCEEVVTTASAHGLDTGDMPYLDNFIAGMSNVKNKVWTITKLTNTTYSLNGSSPANGIRTSGGMSYCTEYGCRYYRFMNANGTYAAPPFQINNCTAERLSETYTDAAPSTALFMKTYRPSGANCVTPTIMPLTSDKVALHALANSLPANASTSGHLGLAWGWYMISPNFAYIWPEGSKPDSYGKSKLVKAVVFMTDGEFNTPYCEGVMAKDTGSSANVGNNDRSNCDAPMGTSKSQAETLCNSVKNPDNKVLLYTVGFDLANNAAALTMLRNCATSVDHFYRADTGADLATAFRSIAQSLSELRLSK
ncbi:MAG: hypothetical protein EOP22_09140 [Hyphomicrobiales bacterium]|nr:MAG: hypothetical protein EOP22_09140 [Hyphomicrobiales bacterium]